ncbi:hypothetical protein O181_000824 [Austropuccinia psidii MF-1]|uniref:Uncharacterized protein n=1 Tax=Austropuccinia psidii MF-1 TaxID=1389203 RepID=A0A9Q3GB99_9BASI|nr:hypothetical protein [Austropuccinia psidii MF-1]
MLKEVNKLQTKTIHTLQEAYNKLSKATEENNKGLNKVLEGKYYCNRNKEYLNKDVKKLLNVFQNMNPQTQGHVSGNIHTPYHQQDIKTDAPIYDKKRYPSQYQDRDNMTHSEKEEEKKLP